MTTNALASARQTVDDFNRSTPIGSPVRFWPWTREEVPRVSKTRARAHLLGGHTPVVWVEGYAGCIALTHVEAIGVGDL